MTFNKLLEISYNLEELTAACTQISTHLIQNGFCLWLEGDLGVGKTTFVRHYLQNLGLNEDYAVVSPTFTYINEYLVNSEWYAHMDFYRLEDSFYPEDSEFFDEKIYAGQFVEWPSRIAKDSNYQATHLAKIIFDPTNSGRRILNFYEVT